MCQQRGQLGFPLRHSFGCLPFRRLDLKWVTDIDADQRVGQCDRTIGEGLLLVAWISLTVMRTPLDRHQMIFSLSVSNTNMMPSRQYCAKLKLRVRLTPDSWPTWVGVPLIVPLAMILSAASTVVE